MTSSLICSIRPAEIHYTIDFHYNLLEECSFLAKFVSGLGSKIAIISNNVVGPLYGESLCRSLVSQGLESHLFIFEDGEKFKTRETKGKLEEQMLEKKYGRDTCIIALGGGVVMDISGFIASTFCRGIPLVMIPTSLLGMVDASIGGKTAVNLTYGKNLIGTIYQPKKVIIDSSVLKTLPLRELKNGLTEMIKHAIILDASYFSYLEKHVEDLLHLEQDKMNQAIYTSCQIKKTIVESDEKELGLRRILNFGHTIGHALEKVSHYQIAHGEAVAIGILVESYLSFLTGYLSKKALDSILTLVHQFNFPFKLPCEVNNQSIITAMQMDKKATRSQARFVMINEIGSTLDFDGNYCTTLDLEPINKALNWMFHDLCSHSRAFFS